MPLVYSDSVQSFCNALDSADSTIACYANNYNAGHVQALENTFPTTRAMMDHDTFTSLAQVYVAHYPARQWDINLYGDSFAELIASQQNGGKPTVYDWLYLACVARVEYAISVLYYAATGLFDKTSACELETSASMAKPTDFSKELQRHHPYTSVNSAMYAGAIIRLWRDQWRIQIETFDVR